MDNSYSLEELIEVLEDLLSDATRVPFNRKSMVDIDKMSDVIEKMRLSMPMEIQQAQRVVMDKNAIIADARREAENIIRGAEQRRAELLDKNDIIREARQRATEMVNAEQNRCTVIRATMNDYVDNMLRRIEELMTADLNNLRTIRGGINGSQNSLQSAHPPLQPMEKPGE